MNISINELDAVILTHAHMDHMGFVPYLFKYGYTGPVYCTPPTRDLVALLLNDYIKLCQRGGGTPAVRREGHKEDAHAHDNKGLRRGDKHNR